MSKLDDGLLLDLIDRVYAAAIEPTQWADVTAALGAAFRAQFSLLFGFDSTRSQVLYAQVHGLPSEVLTPYENTYAALDIRMPAALRAPAGTVVTEESLIDRRVYHASAIYNEYLRPIDCDHIMGVLPCNSADVKVIVSLNRSRRIGPFHSREIAFLQRLVPHLQRALVMSARLVTAEGATRFSHDLMTRVPFGVVTLAEDGRIINANPIAERFLNDGDSLTQVAGRLTAVRRVTNDRLQLAITNAARFVIDRETFHADPLVCSRPNGPPIRLLIAPLAARPRPSEGANPVLVAFLFANDAAETICPATLSMVYGITPAEARIAAKLAEGYSLTQIAAVYSLSIETVRTHIKRVFAKTRCDSQTTLVREILLGPTRFLSRAGA